MKDIKKFLNTRLDASENAFLRRELEHVRTTAYMEEYPEFKARRFISIDSTPKSGVKYVISKNMGFVGRAEVGGDYSTDAPRADVTASENMIRVRPLISSYGYSVDEVQSAMQAGMSLEAWKAAACRYSIEEKMNNVLLLGDSAWGIPGLFTQSGTLTMSPLTVGGETLWSEKTAEDKVQDLLAMEDKIVVDTNEVEKPDTLLLPLTAYNEAKNDRLGDYNSNTVIKEFLQRARYITMVDTSIELQSAPNSEWTGRRAMAFSRSPQKVQGIVTLEYTELAPQERGFETIVPAHAKLAGVDAQKPKSIVYMDTF